MNDDELIQRAREWTYRNRDKQTIVVGGQDFATSMDALFRAVDERDELRERVAALEVVRDEFELKYLAANGALGGYKRLIEEVGTDAGELAVKLEQAQKRVAELERR